MSKEELISILLKKLDEQEIFNIDISKDRVTVMGTDIKFCTIIFNKKIKDQFEKHFNYDKRKI